mmetsp:Transcript_68385/g.216403  ORF Transcript_68385/g.216403 Transcript_68385/m.216403 type:complete len:290 (+) Transcript_68385:173-1042(+)
MDMNKVGLFMAMPSVDVGAPFVTNKDPDTLTRHKGKGFVGVGHVPTGNNPDALLDKSFKRLSENDVYMNPGALERRQRAKEREKNVSERPFFPTNPPKKSTGPGNKYGCIGQVPEHIYMTKGEGGDEKKAERRETLRNFITAPGKPGATLGPQPDYMPEQYMPARVLEREERKKARERIPKAFVSGGRPSTTGFFSNFTYQAGPDKKPSRDNRPITAPFRPSSPPRKGYNSSISKPLEYMEDPYKPPLRSVDRDRASGVFKPSSGPKSCPVRNIYPSDPQRRPRSPEIF